MLNPAIYTKPIVTLPSGPLVPTVGTLLGVLNPQIVAAQEQADWAALEVASGRKLDLAHTIYTWGKVFPGVREASHIQNGRIPMISWGGYDTTAIANGSQDVYIRSIAANIKALNTRVFIRWFWEMDGSFFAPEVGSPSQFTAAWAHIRSVFNSVGATNVAWIWR